MSKIIKLPDSTQPKIEVMEDRRPRVQCPKCKQIFMMDIRPFEKDITKPIRDKCIKCGQELHVALLILMNPNLRLLYAAIQACIQATDPDTLLEV